MQRKSNIRKLATIVRALKHVSLFPDCSFLFLEISISRARSLILLHSSVLLNFIVIVGAEIHSPVEGKQSTPLKKTKYKRECILCKRCAQKPMLQTTTRSYEWQCNFS